MKILCILLASLIPAMAFGQAFSFSDPVGTITASGSGGGGTTTGYTNSSDILIHDLDSATPFPSTISVSSFVGNATKVTVSLVNFGHAFTGDVHILLVGPSGANCAIMFACGNNTVSGVNLTFDDSAASALAFTGTIVSGTYKPSKNDSGTMNAPAPAPAYGTTMSVFNGISPNGTWSLYVQDNNFGDSGDIPNGWYLRITD